jgi:hypothetical protein
MHEAGVEFGAGSGSKWFEFTRLRHSNDNNVTNPHVGQTYPSFAALSGNEKSGLEQLIKLRFPQLGKQA